MSGWVTPPTSPAGGPTPVLGWVAPDAPPGLGVGESIRAGWGLVRAHLGPVSVIAAVPVALLSVLTLPVWLMTAQVLETMVTFWANVDWTRYRGDPGALQRDWQAAFQPSGELSAVIAISGALSFVVWMIGTAAVTAALVEAMRGRRPSIFGAYRTVASHPGALIVPALVIGLGYALILIPLGLRQDDLLGPTTLTARATVSGLLSIVVLVLEVVALYFAIRWSLYFQAVLDEGVGMRAALARSADLTSGVRVRIGLTLIVVGILIGIVMGLAILIVGLVAGIVARSFMVGVGAGLVAVMISAVVYLPFFVGILTHIYRRRVDALEGEAGTASP